MKLVIFMKNLHYHRHQVNSHISDIPIFYQTLTDWLLLFLMRYRLYIWLTLFWFYWMCFFVLSYLLKCIWRSFPLEITLFATISHFSSLACFFHTLHAGQRLMVLDNIFFENTLPQFSHAFKSFRITIMMLFPSKLFLCFSNVSFHELKPVQKYPSILPNEIYNLCSYTSILFRLFRFFECVYVIRCLFLISL